MTDLKSLKEKIEDWPNMFSDGKTNYIPVRDVLDLIDGAVEQEPCDDVVSRQAAIDTWSIKDVADTLAKHGLMAEQEPCDDAISRDMALEKMADYVASGYADSAEDFEEYSRIICQLPSVRPQEQAGHWISHYDEDAKEGWYECDRCHTERAFNTDYCPDCGADMRKESE